MKKKTNKQKIKPVDREGAKDRITARGAIPKLGGPDSIGFLRNSVRSHHSQ